MFVVSFSCWLNPHGYFIQTFIVPVVLVILANIGFFIMALVIMNRHAKKQTHKNRIQRARYMRIIMIAIAVCLNTYV